MGIGAGEWQFLTVPQLEFFMRPEHAPELRVYACGLRHSIGRGNGRRAMVQNGRGKLAPMQPIDIVRSLNEYDPAGKMTKQWVRRCLQSLEEQGAVRHAGRRVRGGAVLFFYARPLKAKDVPGPVELPDEAELAAEEETAAKSLPLPELLRFQMRQAATKMFRSALTKAVKSANVELSDEAKAKVRDLEERLLEPVEAAVADLLELLGVEKPHTPAATVVSIAPVNPAAVAQPPQLAELRGLFPDELLEDETLAQLDARIAAATQDAEYDRSALVEFVRAKLVTRRNGFRVGLVLRWPDEDNPNGGLGWEFAQKWASSKAERQAAAAASANAAQWSEHERAERFDMLRRWLTDPWAEDAEKQDIRRNYPEVADFTPSAQAVEDFVRQAAAKAKELARSSRDNPVAQRDTKARLADIKKRWPHIWAEIDGGQR